MFLHLNNHCNQQQEIKSIHSIIKIKLQLQLKDNKVVINKENKINKIWVLKLYMRFLVLIN